MALLLNVFVISCVKFCVHVLCVCVGGTEVCVRGGGGGEGGGKENVCGRVI